MPDDCRKGFFRFQTDDFQFLIANEKAWSAPGLNKRFVDDFAGNCALVNLNAIEAVGIAAQRKALRNQDPPDQPTDVVNDIFIENYSMLDIL